jgi:chemotaxis family two-component system sensor kinase Cph1
LRYAEMGIRAEQTPEAVDLNAVLKKALHNLSSSIAASGASVTAGTLPVLRVAESHFLQVFQNLIGNAIKYRSHLPPRVEISVRESGPDLIFSVTDNGIGIDSQYHDKIFVAFKRLHGKDVPGAGIGLAICKRAMDHYNGRIWVESHAHQGATFLFAVPAALRCQHAEEHATASGPAQSRTASPGL